MWRGGRGPDNARTCEESAPRADIDRAPLVVEVDAVEHSETRPNNLAPCALAYANGRVRNKSQRQRKVRNTSRSPYARWDSRLAMQVHGVQCSLHTRATDGRTQRDAHDRIAARQRVIDPATCEVCSGLVRTALATNITIFPLAPSIIHCMQCSDVLAKASALESIRFGTWCTATSVPPSIVAQQYR
jgi:hypothetical protein